MRNKFLLGLTLSVVLLAGCAVTTLSVLNSISAWIPVAVSGFVSFETIVNPKNTSVAADGAHIEKDFADLKTAILLTLSAGAGTTGAPAVSAKLGVIIAAIPTFEADVANAGGNISANDRAYIAAGAALAETALTVYQAELGGPVANLRSINGGCYGIEVAPDGSATAWVDCTEDSEEAIFASLDPIPQTITAAPTVRKYNVRVKHAKLGNYKRQFNALARLYNHPNQQIKLTMAEHLHIS